MRVCDICLQVDDHPRHVIAFPRGNGRIAGPVEIAKILALNLPSDVTAAAVSSAMDGSAEDRHMDCCRSVGCFDGTCDQVAALNGDRQVGDDLLAALTTDEVGDMGRKINEERARNDTLGKEV